MLLHYLLAGVLGYILGNIQFAVIFSRLIHNDDVRKYGSGGAGATNMLRVYGLRSGLLTFVFDFLKGVLSVWIGRAVGGELGAYLCAFFTVLGHDYPIFLKFRGGKGVASTFAVLWMICPAYAGIITALALILLAATKTVSIASVSCAVLYMILVLIFELEHTYFILLSIALVALLVIRHKDNICRLLKGEESKALARKE